MAASFPTAVKSFTTKLTGDTIQAAHVNDMQDEITAIEQVFVVSGTIPGNVTASGNWTHSGSLSAVTITLSGGQVVFPPTQNASADPNTLDDYEEGTFTPTIASAGGGTPTYTTQQGAYTKIGNLVNFWGRVTLATKGTLAAGAITITSLPFSAGATYFGSALISFWNITTAVIWIPSYIQAGSAILVMQKVTAATAASGTANLMDTDLSATADFIFFGAYKV